VAVAIAGERMLANAQDVQVQIGAPPPGAAAPAGPMSFEVASVKPNKAGGQIIRIGIQQGGRFVANNVTVQQLVVFAYQVQNFQIVGSPDWSRDDRFDINAKAEGDVPPAPLGVAGPMQMMVRSLLADRFKLTLHMDTREMPIYALVLARPDGRLGPQLTRSSVDCTGRGGAGRGRGDAGRQPAPPAPGERPQCGMFGGLGQFRAGGMALSELARILSGQVQRVVIDRTGLTGTFDFDLTYTPDQLPQGPPPPGAQLQPPVDPNGPSIFTALEEQLGLKLDAQRGPVPVLVIDHVEPPTPD
jgi:uncharacterized protein (TIGR03435 family)